MPKRIVTLLIVLLLLALALYYVPWPRAVEFRSTCVEVDRQGNVLSDESEIVLSGTYYHYLFQPDTISLTSLEIPGVGAFSGVAYSNGAPTVKSAPEGYDFIWYSTQVDPTGDDNKPGERDLLVVNLFTHSDFPYLAIILDEKYFVTTNDGAPDAVSMLKEFCLYLDNSEI